MAPPSRIIKCLIKRTVAEVWNSNFPCFFSQVVACRIRLTFEAILNMKSKDWIEFCWVNWTLKSLCCYCRWDKWGQKLQTCFPKPSLKGVGLAIKYHQERTGFLYLTSKAIHRVLSHHKSVLPNKANLSHVYLYQRISPSPEKSRYTTTEGKGWGSLATEWSMNSSMQPLPGTLIIYILSHLHSISLSISSAHTDTQFFFMNHRVVSGRKYAPLLLNT